MGRKRKYEKPSISSHPDIEMPFEVADKEETSNIGAPDVSEFFPETSDVFIKEKPEDIVVTSPSTNEVIGIIHPPKEETQSNLSKVYYDEDKAKCNNPIFINFSKVIIENINPELKAEYATDGSMAIDLVTREEIEIPCNHFFKQAENIIGFLFDKVKDIYTGNMKAETSWEGIDSTIKRLNSNFNKYPQILIPMNIKIKYPEGYGALLLPRSSTFKKYGLLQANSIGLIDTDFCLEHGFPVINLSNKNITIPAGTRIAQLLFIKKEILEMVNGIVEQHDKHNGNGSTGN